MAGFYIPFDFEGDTELNCRICPWKNWEPRRESDYCAHIDRIVDGSVISGTRPKECQARIIPAADVVGVRHGRWLPSDIPDSILDKCSECGFDTGAFTFRYCPSCGAKMDLPEPPKEEA